MIRTVTVPNKTPTTQNSQRKFKHAKLFSLFCSLLLITTISCSSSIESDKDSSTSTQGNQQESTSDESVEDSTSSQQASEDSRDALIEIIFSEFIDNYDFSICLVDAVQASTGWTYEDLLDDVINNDGNGTDEIEAEVLSCLPYLDDEEIAELAGATGDLELPVDETTSSESLENDSDESWTILIYLMGDTDLEEYALEDILEMAAVPNSPNLNIVTFFDRSESYANEGVLNVPDFTDTKILQVTNGELLVLNDNLGEKNLGSAETFAEFIDYGLSTFPADKTGLILWDHGAGWPGMGPDEDSGDDILTLQEMVLGLQLGLANSEIDKLDLIGFDACLMATYEVAKKMAPFANIMVASQELEPGHGWDYEVLEVITTNPSIEASELGTEIANSYLDHAVSYGTEIDITLSVIDLNKIDILDQAIRELSNSFLNASLEISPKLGLSVNNSLRFGKSPNPIHDSQMSDIGDFAATLGLYEPDLLIDSNNLVDAMNNVLISQVTGPATKSATGLSIYFPKLSEYANEDYEAIPDLDDWKNLLKEHFSLQENIPDNKKANIVTDTFEPSYSLDDDGLLITAQFDIAVEENLTESVIYYGIPEDDGSILFIGEEPGEISNDGSGLVEGFYDLTALTMSDGIDTVYAYSQITTDEPYLYLDIPLAYLSPEDAEANSEHLRDVVLSLTVDDTGEIVSEIYYEIDGNGQWGELTANPEGLVFPIFSYMSPDFTFEWIADTGLGLYANLSDLEYSFEPLESGVGFTAELWIFDFGGNSDYVTVSDIVP